MPTLPASATGVVISVNPKAGRHAVADKIRALQGLLVDRGLTVEIHDRLERVAELANAWHAEGTLRAVVGVGGDGTAAELSNRLTVGAPLTLLACGTANVLAKHLGLDDNPHRLCQTILAGRVLRMDAGQAGGRLFLAMFGAGFDARVVERLHAWRAARGGSHISYLSYLKPILESIRTYDYPEIQVDCLDPPEKQAPRGTFPLPARWVFLLNLPRYGWGVRLAPQAASDDGLLDLCTFRHGSLWNGLRYAAAAQLGLHGRMPDCTLGRGRRFRLSSDRPLPYEVDGDPGGQLPVEVEVLPGRLTLLAPAASSLGAPVVRMRTGAEP